MTMDADAMETETTDQVSASPLHFARSYQVEALEKAIKQNTIVFLETGSGKTLIAIMLLRSYAYLFRKPSPCFCVFLVPQVVLVTQVLVLGLELWTKGFTNIRTCPLFYNFCIITRAPFPNLETLVLLSPLFLHFSLCVLRSKQKP
jgi:hypothetical protein